MVNTTASNGMSKAQRELLLTVFSDCREYYHSRQAFDKDYKSLSHASLDDLYAAWKGFNRSLASGSYNVSVPILSNWPFSVGRSTSDSIRAIRQVLGLYSRLEGFCDSSPALAAYSARVSASRGSCPVYIREIARNLIAAWLGSAPVLMDLHPQHGPGAVAEGYSQIEKINPAYTFRQLRLYGGDDLLYLNSRHKSTEPRTLVELKHPITRVVCVPKDFSKPRIISAEPCVMQFLQQGLARHIMAKLEMNCPYVNFRDQSVNAQLARRHDDVATLDMSDASDLVSRRIVRQLFPKDWADLLFSLRSHFAKLPDGTTVPLRAFAPMGSALCFPVESIVFAAITVAAYFVFTGNDRAPGKARELLRIYGDDIIVPIEAGQFVMAVLRECGFRPNESKCCVSGYFRESCGAEWWRGEDITVTRPRSLNPHHACLNKPGLSAAMPMALHAQSLYQRGFTNAAQYLASLCKFPVAIGNGAAYVTPDLKWPWPGKIRWNRNLQRAEQETTVPVQGTKASSIGDQYAALFLGLASGWQSELVLTPRIKPKRKWVLAAPLADR